MSLSVVMPVYNEEEIIEKVVRGINREVVSKIPDSEFIIVDDCSTDSTLKILKKLGKDIKKIRILSTQVNSGHGKALRLGFLNAKKEWVFHIDSDNEYRVSDFWKLYKLKNNYDIILGYRKHRQDPMHRLVLTRIARLFNMALFGFLIKDANSAFKLVNRKSLQHIISVLPDNAFTCYSILVSVMGRNLKYRIMEMPVKHYGRKTGTCHYIGWKLIKGAAHAGGDMLLLRMKSLGLPRKEYKKAEEIRSSTMKNR